MKKVEKKNHSFNKDVASKIGIFPAVILTGLSYWVEYFQKTGKNFYDGYYWVYNSITSWQEFYPYATQKQIRTALEKLRDEGYILTANYNKAPFDRTLWYTITDKAIDMLNNEDSSNYIPPANTPVEAHESVKEEKYKDEIKEIIDYLNTKLGSNYRYKTESTNKLIRARLNEGFTVDNFKQVIDTKYVGWINDPKMSGYLRPSTLFGNKFEQYLNEKVKQSAQSQVTRKEWDGKFYSDKKY